MLCQMLYMLLFSLSLLTLLDPGSVGSSVVKPYKFKMSEIEGFRYRVQVHDIIYLSCD